MSSKRKPHPTQRELQELFFYDTVTGHLHWKIKPSKKIQLGSVAGSVHQSSGYCRVAISGSIYKAHSLIWIWNYGDIPNNLIVDHRDRNRANNCLYNLRLSTARQQELNKNIRGFIKQTGCRINPWRATHSIDNKKKYIGSYPTALQARLAYERYTSGLEPEFASTWLTDAVREFCSGGTPTVWMPGVGGK